MTLGGGQDLDVNKNNTLRNISKNIKKYRQSTAI
jgi:hypothetical protein